MQFSELIRRIGITAELKDGPDPEVQRICEDSRQVQPGDLFIARSGTKTSGSKFAADALAKGALAIVSDEPLDLPPNIAHAKVAHGNEAAALLAQAIADYPAKNIKLIAVTGTKGETTVAYLLRSVLKAAGHKCGMIGTVEIDDGNSAVPADMTTPSAVDLANLFTRMRDNHVTHCVMEVSSHALHQHRTAGLDFAVAIFTNLTGDHLDYHKTMEEYAAAKAILFRGLARDAVAVVNVDDKWGEWMLRNCRARVVKYRVELDMAGNELQRTAKRPQGGWSGLITNMTSEEMVINIAGPEMELPKTGRKLPYLMKLFTPLVGKHNAYNLTSVYAAAYGLGFGVEELLEATRALLQAKGAPGRLQRVESGKDFQVFVDYAHTHDALQNVLTALRQTMQSKIENRKSKIPAPRLICLFGCGGDRDRTKRPKMAKIAQDLADLVVLTSDNPRTENPQSIIDEVTTGFAHDWKQNPAITIQPDRRLAIQTAINLAQPGDVVLLAGKGHENYQILGTTKHHFDDVEEATAALQNKLATQHPSPT